jgi:DNA-binding beta-propeller fold protein YncE
VATRSGGTAAIAFTPNGTSAYVVGTNISQYSINATTGDLTPKSPATVATPPNPEPIAVSPNGKYAYVANCGGCGCAHKKTLSHAAAGPASAKPPSAKPSYLVEYRINGRTGALSPKPVARVTTGNGANWMAIAPSGKSVYVATSTGVWQYTINPTSGEPTPKNPRSTGPTEHNIVISSNGKNAYVIGDTTRGVCQYRVNPRTGTLNSKSVSTAPTVLHPEAIAISADGKNAYVTSENDGEVAQYKIDPTTGKITATSPATVATASGSLGLAVTPATRLSPAHWSCQRTRHGRGAQWLRLAGFLGQSGRGVPPRSPACRASGRTSQNRGALRWLLPLPLIASPATAASPAGGCGQHAGRQVYLQPGGWHACGTPARQGTRRYRSHISDPSHCDLQRRSMVTGL